jgi:hypothetical protein
MPENQSPTVETVATPPKKFTVETVETIKRSYEIKAPDRETAVKRLRLHWGDPEALRDGVVTKLAAETVSSRQVREKG